MGFLIFPIYFFHYFFPLWPSPSYQILITPFDSFLHQTATPSSLLPLLIPVTTQTFWVFKISTLPSTLSHSVPPQLLPHSSIDRSAVSMLDVILQELVFMGNWVIGYSQITLFIDLSTGFKVWKARMFPIKWLLLNLRKKLDLHTNYMISPDKSSW